jgi:hypothetical protein
MAFLVEKFKKNGTWEKIGEGKSLFLVDSLKKSTISFLVEKFKKNGTGGITKFSMAK